MFKHPLRLILPVLFGGIAFMMQISPDDAVSNLSKWIGKATSAPIPDWIRSPSIDSTITVLAALIAFSGLIWFFWPQLSCFRETSWKQLKQRELLDNANTKELPNEFVPLFDAVKTLYEFAREKGTLLATLAERLSGSENGQIASGTPENVLDFIATYVGRRISIYGSRPPSDRKELIPENEVAISKFENGALILKNDNHIYTALEISKSDLGSLLLHLKKNEI